MVEIGKLTMPKLRPFLYHFGFFFFFTLQKEYLCHLFLFFAFPFKYSSLTILNFLSLCTNHLSGFYG
jgi:hypothetical protein